MNLIYSACFYFFFSFYVFFLIIKKYFFGGKCVKKIDANKKIDWTLAVKFFSYVVYYFVTVSVEIGTFDELWRMSLLFLLLCCCYCRCCYRCWIRRERSGNVWWPLKNCGEWICCCFCSFSRFHFWVVHSKVILDL